MIWTVWPDVGDTLRMKRVVVAAVVLTLAGCASTPTTGVQPGDGPAATEVVEPTAPVEGEGQFTEEPLEEPTDEPEPEVASFKEKYTYPDGVEVEIIKIRHGKLTAYEAEIDGNAKRGQDYVIFTVRVRNGSKQRLKLAASGTVSYGPDGEVAESAFVENMPSGSLDGTVLPGKAKSAPSSAWLVPGRWQGDVVYEFAPSFDYSAAIFSGSVK